MSNGRYVGGTSGHLDETSNAYARHRRNLEREDATILRNMIRALDGPLAWMNTDDDTARLAAARDILKARRNSGRK